MAKAGRKSKVQMELDERQKILTEVDRIALNAAPAAMKVLVESLTAEATDRQKIAAAQDILNRVVGKPSEREAFDDQTSAVHALLDEIKSIRKSDASS